MTSKAVKTTIPTEHQEQVAFIQWMKYQHPAVRYFSVPNSFFGVNFGIINKLKKEGMQKGIPDFFILEWRIVLEFKKQKGSKPTPEQIDWMNYFEEKCGLKCIVAYGCQDAIKKVQEFLQS